MKKSKVQETKKEEKTTKFQCTEESKTTHSVMKDFKVVPYPEISKRLDEATKKTVAFINRKKKKDP